MAEKDSRSAGGGKNGRKADRRVAKTNAAIREAFERLAAQGDFRKITITSLAAEANIDRKTFYLHYQSVDELVEEMARERAETIVSDMERALRKHGDAVTATDILRELAKRNPFDLPANAKAAIHVPVEDVLGHIERLLADALVSLGRHGRSLSPSEECRLRYGVSFIAAGSLAVYKRWVLEHPDLSLDELCAMVSVAALEGMSGIARELGSEGH